MLPKPPLAVRLGVLLISAALAASALYGLWAGALATGQVIPGAVAFEALILLAGAFGVLMGLGRFANGFGIGVLTIGGTIFTCAVLGFLDVRANLAGEFGRMEQTLRLMVMTRVAGSAGLAALAGVAVLSRTGRSWRVFGTGLAVGLAPAAMLGAGVVFRGWLLTPAEGPVEIVRVAVLLLGALLVCVLASISLGTMIRAFELGPDGTRLAAAPKGRPPAGGGAKGGATGGTGGGAASTPA